MNTDTRWRDAQFGLLNNVPSSFENSRKCEELMCQSRLKVNSELQEMRIELKPATATINILKEELDIVYDMNGSIRTMQGHDENIQSAPHELKWVQVTTKYQGKKRNSTIDQLKSKVQTNKLFEELTNLKGTID